MNGPYLLFAGDTYYPCGGWEDLVCVIDAQTDEQADTEARKIARGDWWHVAVPGRGIIAASHYAALASEE